VKYDCFNWAKKKKEEGRKNGEIFLNCKEEIKFRKPF